MAKKPAADRLNVSTTTQPTTPPSKPKPVTDRLRLQRVFARMKQSCYDPTHMSYHNYGGRGIYIAAEWLDTGSSEAFVQWAFANGYQQGLDINRVDNDGPYAPWNCQFISRQENMLNCRTTIWSLYQGVQQPLARVLLTVAPTHRSIIRKRVQRGMTLEEALTMPIRPQKQTPPKPPLKAFLYEGKLAVMKVHAQAAGFEVCTRVCKALRARMEAGWDLHRVFNTPIRPRS